MAKLTKRMLEDIKGDDFYSKINCALHLANLDKEAIDDINDNDYRKLVRLSLELFDRSNEEIADLYDKESLNKVKEIIKKNIRDKKNLVILEETLVNYIKAAIREEISEKSLNSKAIEKLKEYSKEIDRTLKENPGGLAELSKEIVLFAKKNRKISVIFKDIAIKILAYFNLIYDIRLSTRAIENLTVKGIRELIKSNNDFDFFNKNSIDGYIKIIKYITNHDAIDNNIIYENQSYMLHKALENNHFELAKMLINQGHNLNIKNENYNTALHEAADKGHKEIAKLLIEKGAKLNLESLNHGTALGIAIEKGHTEIAKLLIENGADLNFKSYFSGTALDMAIEKGNKGIAKLLIQNGATISSDTEKLILKNLNGLIKSLVNNKIISVKEALIMSPSKRSKITYGGKNLVELIISGYVKFDDACRYNRNQIKLLADSYGDIIDNRVTVEELVRRTVERVNQNLQVNGQQSTHNNSVHKSTLQSAIKLKHRYKNIDMNATIEKARSYLNNLPEVLDDMDILEDGSLPEANKLYFRRQARKIEYKALVKNKVVKAKLIIPSSININNTLEVKKYILLEALKKEHIPLVHLKNYAAKRCFDRIINTDVKNYKDISNAYDLDLISGLTNDSEVKKWRVYIGFKKGKINYKLLDKDGKLQEGSIYANRFKRSDLNFLESVSNVFNNDTLIKLNNLSLKGQILKHTSERGMTHKSDVTIGELIPLIYQGILDDENRSCSLEDAQGYFVDGLYQMQREYNITTLNGNKNIEMDNKEFKDSPACMGGTYNKFIQILETSHPDCKINHVNKHLAAQKLPRVVVAEVIRFLNNLKKSNKSRDLQAFNNVIKKIKDDYYSVESIYSCEVELMAEISANEPLEINTLYLKSANNLLSYKIKDIYGVEHTGNITAEQLGRNIPSEEDLYSKLEQISNKILEIVSNKGHIPHYGEIKEKVRYRMDEDYKSAYPKGSNDPDFISLINNGKYAQLNPKDFLPLIVEEEFSKFIENNKSNIKIINDIINNNYFIPTSYETDFKDRIIKRLFEEFSKYYKDDPQNKDFIELIKPIKNIRLKKEYVDNIHKLINKVSLSSKNHSPAIYKELRNNRNKKDFFYQSRSNIDRTKKLITKNTRSSPKNKN